MYLLSLLCRLLLFCFTSKHWCVPELALLLHPYILRRDVLFQLNSLQGHLHVANSRISIFNPVPRNLRFTYPIANLTSSFEYLIGISNITCLNRTLDTPLKPTLCHLRKWLYHLPSCSAKNLRVIFDSFLCLIPQN